MADGLNPVRIMRIQEVVNDIYEFQTEILDHASGPMSKPPDAKSAPLQAYQLLKQGASSCQAILGDSYAPPLGIDPHNDDASEERKAQLQQILLEAGVKRIHACRMCTNANSAMRYLQLRKSMLQKDYDLQREAPELRLLEMRLRDEVGLNTEKHLYRQLRNSDQEKERNLNVDPSLEKISAWARTHR